MQIFKKIGDFLAGILILMSLVVLLGTVFIFLGCIAVAVVLAIALAIPLAYAIGILILAETLSPRFEKWVTKMGDKINS
jgi:hypothetical protein